MKKSQAILRGVVFVLGLVLTNIVHAQLTDTNALNAIEATTPSAADSVPLSGTFYSAQNPNNPPLPGNMNNSPAWDLGGGFYLLDDLDVDYSSRGMRAMDDLSPPDFGEEGGDYTSYTFTYSFPTNGLWLEITNVSNGLAHVNLHHATNKVYEIWSKTDLTFTNWDIETEVFPGTSTNTLPFTVSQLNRTNLFLWARDWTGVTNNGNTTPEWWFWLYFGTVGLSDTNLDNVGNSLLFDYQFSLDPNVIQFSLRFTNGYVAASPVYGTIDLVGGMPSYMAVLINDTNQAHAVWQSYSPSVVANLNLGDGTYTVMVGLRGLAPNATPTWVETTLTLNTASFVITVTNPVASTVWRPMVQVQGFANKPLASLNYDISNANGIFTNQSGLITGQTYDTNLLASASYFQCYDLALTNGINRVTLHATDVFGNTTTTNMSITLDYGTATNPPALTLIWPTNNTMVAGTNFTLHGLLDDATASVVVSVGASTFPGLVERDGRFSVANLPLSGTNVFTISATNVAGLGVSQTLTVVQGTVLVKINPLSAIQQEFITVTGTVGDNSHDVYVNGVKATVSSNLTWSVTNVPVLDNQGSGQLTINAYPSGSDASVTSPTASLQAFNAMQPTVQAVSYQEQFRAHDAESVLYYGNEFYDTKIARQWANGGGGTTVETSVEAAESIGYFLTRTINLSWPIYWPDGQALNGTISAPCCTEAYNLNAPTTWANATLEAGGTVPFNSFVLIGTSQRQMTRNAVTEVQLVAGGPALPGAFQLIRLLVSAAGYSDNGLIEESGFYDTYLSTGFEGLGDVPLPATDIQVLGQAVTPTATNANVGETYVILPAGGVQDLPINVTGTNSNNYSFNMQPMPGLTIVDGNSGQDLTTQTNTVIVGQQMNLICKTVTINGPTLNNFQWTVPGFAISNYLVAADGSSAVVVTNFPLNNSNVVFYWVDGGSNRTIQCSATVDGKTVTGQATFNIYRPSITFTDSPPSWVTNAVVDGVLSLSLGDGSFGDMEYEVNILSAYSGKSDFTQLIDGSAASGTHTSSTGGNYWLDNFRFYNTKSNDPLAETIPVFANTTRLLAFFDGPNLTLTDSVFNHTASIFDQFKDYIMFRPDNGNANNNIYVPLGKITWSWSASTTFSGGVWSTPTSAITRPGTPDGGYEFPQWPNIFNNN